MIKSLDEYIEHTKEMAVLQSAIDPKDGSYNSLLCQEAKEQSLMVVEWLEELKRLRKIVNR